MFSRGAVLESDRLTSCGAVHAVLDNHDCGVESTQFAINGVRLLVESERIPLVGSERPSRLSGGGLKVIVPHDQVPLP